MGVNANKIIDLEKTSSFKLTPANAGVYAFFLHSLNLRNRTTPNALGVMYDFALTDVAIGYAAHVANATAHGGAPDITNVVVDVPVDVQVLNKVMGEYAKAISPAFAVWNVRQIERNEPWADHINLIAWLYNFSRNLEATVTAFNAHKNDVAGVPGHGIAVPVADIPALTIALPTPDGIVPSIGYNAGFSKYLAEIERTEPAFVKARLATWIKDIAVAAQTIIVAFNEHAVSGGAGLAHVAPTATLTPIARV